jgi:iron(III) transport system ATP-binding protein
MKGLHIYGVSHAYGDHQVLNDVGLMVPAGELVCLLGPSGCGKSTLLRLAAGLETLQHGSVVINDVEVANKGRFLPPEERKVGLMFQDYALFPHLDVLGNVMFGLLGLSKADAKERAMEMLDQVGMTSHAHKHPHMLSGGQQQRVALARALAPKPELLLLDEPFSGLDTAMRRRIREQTLDVLKRSGVATLMVTHDPEEAMFMADRIKVMGENGEILQSGPPHEIFYHPKHEFVARLFGIMNQFEGVVRGGNVDTPFGSISAQSIADGEAVSVLIRPEGIHLTDDQTPGVAVEVLSTHLLGHDSLMRARPVGDDGSIYRPEFHVRVHNEFDPALIYPINAHMEPEYTFVFPKDGGPVFEQIDDPALNPDLSLDNDLDVLPPDKTAAE